MDDSHAALRRLILGLRTTQLIAVAAQLGIADALCDTPRSVAALADELRVDADALRRLLRALARLGVFAEADDGRIAHTPLSQPLRRAADRSLHHVAQLYGAPWLWQAYGALLHSVRSGRPAFEHVHGQPFYDYLDSHPAAAEQFNRTMSAFTAHEVAALAVACDLAGAGTVVDVGGGHGALVAALLQRHPRLRGVVFERADVVDGARRTLADAGLAARSVCIAGDFFERVPDGGDVYLLKSVLHNWRDDDALRILRACRRALPPHARLLIAERVIAPGAAGTEAALFDINMMVTVGGQERSEPEYAALLGAAGLRWRRTSATASPLSVIEATRA
jgi:SAM-dependent methyltransferase